MFIIVSFFVNFSLNFLILNVTALIYKKQDMFKRFDPRMPKNRFLFLRIVKFKFYLSILILDKWILKENTF